MKKQIDQKSGHGCQIYNLHFQKILCVTILLFWCTRIFTANIFHRVATLLNLLIKFPNFLEYTHVYKLY